MKNKAVNAVGIMRLTMFKINYQSEKSESFILFQMTCVIIHLFMDKLNF